MEQKTFILLNKGMNRDLSISKVGESNAWENVNVRIESREQGTTMSVTNERGTLEVASVTLPGIVIGANVLNNHLIVFTQDAGDPRNPDKIFLCTYDNGKFTHSCLYTGSLNFDAASPIESVVYYESEEVQKIYWVDGRNPLRMMNFMASDAVLDNWDDNSFDVNRKVEYGVVADISKDNSGSSRANGTVQYLLTYYDEYGAESGIAWISDLVYLSPFGHGGSADGYNNNCIKIVFAAKTLDTTFSSFRVYSLFRSIEDGGTVAYRVGDFNTSRDEVVVVDDGAHLSVEDASALLYLGSRPVCPGTIAHKDQTLFLGDLKNTGGSVVDIEELIHSQMFDFGDDSEFVENRTWHSKCVEFVYSDNTTAGISDIPLEDNGDIYSYRNQLELTSSQIMTFKGGEKYRFALKFRMKDGSETDAFWIGDAVNDKYPIMDVENSSVKRVVAKCIIPASLASSFSALGCKAVQLLIAEATMADRSVLAQGIVNPTVFNAFERTQGRLYSMPSWVSRPINSRLAFSHFEAIHSSGSTDGEIQCNWWSGTDTPTPYYRYKKDASSGKWKVDLPKETNAFPYRMMMLRVSYEQSWLRFQYKVSVCITDSKDMDVAYAQLLNVSTSLEVGKWCPVGENARVMAFTVVNSEVGNHGSARRGLHRLLRKKFNEVGINDGEWCVSSQALYNMCERAFRQEVVYYNVFDSTLTTYTSYEKAFAASGSNKRWRSTSEEASGDYSAGLVIASAIKNLMFVDENVVTLDSPELTYDAVRVDNVDCKFRIVGAARMKSILADYTIDASGSLMPGTSVYTKDMSAADASDKGGIYSYPLWREFGLTVKSESKSIALTDRTSSDYEIEKGGTAVRYWLNMWQSSGNITKFSTDEYSGHSELKRKVFANMNIAKESVFFASPDEFTPDSVRQVFDTDDSQLLMKVGEDTRYYSGISDTVLSMPVGKKYPILYSSDTEEDVAESESAYLYSETPVGLQYRTGNHALISLLSDESDTLSYKQKVLPRIRYDMAEGLIYDRIPTLKGASSPILPWKEELGEELAFFNIQPCALDNYDYNRYDFKLPENQQELLKAFLQVGNAENVKHCLLVYVNDSMYLIQVDGAVFGLGEADVVTVPYREPIAKIIPEVDISEVFVAVRAYSISGQEIKDEGWNNLNFYFNSKTPTFELESVASWRGYSLYGDAGVSFGKPNSNLAHKFDVSDQYLFIGELYREFGDDDTRYGGITQAAIAANRFIAAGPIYNLSADKDVVLYGNHGDTYFQRFDALRTKPYSESSENNVIDIVSAMLETHINLDGRTDVQRAPKELASIDYENFAPLNRVYGQKNNFFVSNDLPDSFNRDSYRSSIAWTLPKVDMAPVDNWAHITLANVLDLDGDKGICRSIKRFGNSLIAFQDRGISEILFNSRTQLSTEEGVPIEIANSGKVEGKRYLTEKYGCLNKWSITEGKAALYFVDNITKAFCAFNGSIENLSLKLHFSSWFRAHNNMSPWNPKENNNFRTFYDRVHNDVYILSEDSEHPALVYNEGLGAFTSFFDYHDVDFMANIEDEFVSLRNSKLYLQNKGKYNEFFGTKYPSEITYRVAPDPALDKVWTNMDVQVDFYDTSKFVEDPEEYITPESYVPDMCFDELSVWNEYQNAKVVGASANPKKRFRTWHYTMPRAAKSGSNKFGLDHFRNPWIFVKFTKCQFPSASDYLMQLHEIVIKYFE